MTENERKLKEAASTIFYNKPEEPPRYGWRYGQKKPPSDMRDVLFYNRNAEKQRIMPA